MPRTDSFNIETPEVWNIAADFVKFKFTIPMIKIDQMEEIATYGTSDFLEEFVMKPEQKDLARIKAIDRLRFYLEQILRTAKFVLKEQDKKKCLEYIDTLFGMKKVLPTTHSETIRNNKKVPYINNELFDGCLDILVMIKQEMNEPLNRAKLIFSGYEEFDPKKFKESISERFIGGE